MTPIPRKLALCMALAGCGVSLPAAASASADGRAAIAALNDAFGFTDPAARPAARNGQREEALARLAALGLAPVDAYEESAFNAPANVLPPVVAVPAGPPAASRDSGPPTDADRRVDLGIESEPAARTAAALDALSHGELPARGRSTPTAGTEAVLPSRAAPSSAADAMAEALALVVLVDADRRREAPLVPQHTAPAASRGPTAGRPPRAAAEAGVEPWAPPLATALPDLDLGMCRIELPPPRLDAARGAPRESTAGAPELDLELSLHAPSRPLTTRTAAEGVAARATARPDSGGGGIAVSAAIGSTLDEHPDSIGITLDMHPDIDLGGVGIALGATPHIDLGGVDIGTTPDSDLGRAAGETPLPPVDIDPGLLAGPTTPAPPAVAEVPAPAAPPAAGAPAPANSSAPRGAAALGVAVAATVDDNRLDRVRGGFSGAGGLEVSFGIERAVYVNGVLVTTTSLNVSGLGGTAAAAATAPIAAAGGGVALVQNGAGNTFLTGSMDAAALGSVVQNTLNNQKIQTVTLINATVNSLQVVKSMNIGSSLRGAMIDSLRR